MQVLEDNKLRIAQWVANGSSVNTILANLQHSNPGAAGLSKSTLYRFLTMENISTRVSNDLLAENVRMTISNVREGQKSPISCFCLIKKNKIK